MLRRSKNSDALFYLVPTCRLLSFIKILQLWPVNIEKLLPSDFTLFPYATITKLYQLIGKLKSLVDWEHFLTFNISSYHDLTKYILSSQSDGDGAWVRYSARYNVHCGHIALSGGGGEAQISAGYLAKIWVVGSGEQRAGWGACSRIDYSYNHFSHFPIL